MTLSLKINQNFIPYGRNNNPATSIYYRDKGYKVYGMVMRPTTITMHNPVWTRTAEELNDYCRSERAAARPASWHFSVDPWSIWQALPVTRPSWHAGDGVNGPGNLTSISIEAVDFSTGGEPSDWNLFWKSMENAARLCAYLIQTVPSLKPFPECMKQHHDWSGKECPRWIRAYPNGWNKFLGMVEGFLEEDTIDEEEIDNTEVTYMVISGSYSKPEYAEEAAQKLRDKGWSTHVEEAVVKGKIYYRVVMGEYTADELPMAESLVQTLYRNNIAATIIHKVPKDPEEPATPEEPEDIDGDDIELPKGFIDFLRELLEWLLIIFKE